MENSVAVPKKTENRITMCSSNSTSVICLKKLKTESLRDNLYTHVHSSIIHNSQNVEATLKYPPMDKWIKKMWYIDTMEYYAALKRKEIMTHATTWMNLEDVLKDISQILHDSIFTRYLE